MLVLLTINSPDLAAFSKALPMLDDVELIDVRQRCVNGLHIVRRQSCEQEMVERFIRAHADD